MYFDDFAALVDQVVDAARGFVLGIVKTVLLGDVTAPITEEGEGNADFLGPGGVTKGAVHAYTQHLGVCSFQLLQILLEVLHLLRSTTGEGEDVKGEGDTLLASEVVQGDLVPLGIEQCEIGSRVADLDGGIGHGVLLFGLSPEPVAGARDSHCQHPQQQDADCSAHVSGPPRIV